MMVPRRPHADMTATEHVLGRRPFVFAGTQADRWSSLISCNLCSWAFRVRLTGPCIRPCCNCPVPINSACCTRWTSPRVAARTSHSAPCAIPIVASWRITCGAVRRTLGAVTRPGCHSPITSPRRSREAWDRAPCGGTRIRSALDAVVRYEGLPGSFHALQEVPGIGQLELRPVGQRLSRHWQYFYDARLAERVYQLTRADFEEFGYDPQSWNLA